MGEAYEQSSLGPLDEYSARVGTSIPVWARREIEIARENIQSRYQEGGELAGGESDFSRLSVPAGSRIVDALIRIDRESGGLPLYRTARVHIEGWMSDDDIIGRIRDIVDDWSSLYGGGDIVTEIEQFWRVQ
jgi:hypothetical protein